MLSQCTRKEGRKDRCCLTSLGGTTAGGGGESYLGAMNWIRGGEELRKRVHPRSAMTDGGKANKAN